MTCSTLRRQPVRLWVFAVLWAVALAAPAFGQTDPLPSWNAGHAKARVVAFVTAVVEPGGKDYVPPGERIATFKEFPPSQKSGSFSVDQVLEQLQSPTAGNK